MRVQAHELFERFMAGLAARPEASLVHSLAEAPRLGEFLDALDPDLSLDWSGQSFQGLPRLREKVLDRTGIRHSCGLDDVLITAGAAEANFLGMVPRLERDDEIIVDVPGWPQPLVLAEAIGARVKPLRRYEENDWRFDMDELQDLITSRTRLIFLCNPNNPTGQVIGTDELRTVARLARPVGAYVLCDEVYAGLEWDDRPVPRIANLYERGISTGSVSKVLGLQGLRLGWLICRDAQVVRDALVLREDTSEIMNIMGEAIADLALEGARYAAALARAKADGRQNLARVDAFIRQRDELRWHPPAAGLIGFCRLSAALDSAQFATRLLAPPYRTFVMPGSAYGYPRHLRLGVGGGAGGTLELALTRMGQLLDRIAPSNEGKTR